MEGGWSNYFGRVKIINYWNSGAFFFFFFFKKKIIII
jgi:hypothetical protein